MRECSQHNLYQWSPANAVVNRHETAEVLQRTSPKEARTRRSQGVLAPPCQPGRPRSERGFETGSPNQQGFEVVELRLEGKLGEPLPVNGVRDLFSSLAPKCGFPKFSMCKYVGAVTVASPCEQQSVRASCRLNGSAFWRLIQVRAIVYHSQLGALRANRRSR
jgi:hypothetical protein